jgi:hypothetical protein
LLHVHQEADCVWSHEFLSAKQIAVFATAHHTVSLHMRGKVNYANTKSGGIDRLVTFAFRAHKTFQINNGSEHKELEYNCS